MFCDHPIDLVRHKDRHIFHMPFFNSLEIAFHTITHIFLLSSPIRESVSCNLFCLLIDNRYTLTPSALVLYT
jgi:hypothetical protein